MSAVSSVLGLAVRVLLLVVAAWWAYDIRLIAIKEFGERSWYSASGHQHSGPCCCRAHGRAVSLACRIAIQRDAHGAQELTCMGRLGRSKPSHPSTESGHVCMHAPRHDVAYTQRTWPAQLDHTL